MIGKVKILYFMDGIGNGGGIQEMVIKWMKNIDREKFQIDILSYNRVNEDDFKERVAALGGKVFIIESFQNPRTFIKSIRQTEEFFHKNKYDILHAHASSKAFFILKYAKKYGVKIRILHSHATKFVTNDKCALMIANILKKPSQRLATDYFACSTEAGRFLFDLEDNELDKLFLAHNAVDSSIYRPNEEIRKKMREELGVGDSFVVGHVGRFMPPKNHAYLIDIFNEVCKLDQESILMCVGNGQLQNEIINKVKSLGLSDRVIFLGYRKDIPDIMQAFDLLLMPSLFEGLPVTGVEAQAIGVPALFSSNITKETKILPETSFMDLSQTPIDWAKKVLEYKNIQREKNPGEYISASHYDIELETKRMEEEYKRILRREAY